jgi:hypothetical protein
VPCQELIARRRIAVRNPLEQLFSIGLGWRHGESPLLGILRKAAARLQIAALFWQEGRGWFKNTPLY